MDSAKALMEYLLAETGAALMDGDFARFAPHFAFPYDIYNAAGKRRCATVEELRHLFQTARDHYATQAVTDIVRSVRHAKFAAEDRLLCMYETRLLTGRLTLHGEPYACLTELRRIDGDWKVMRGEYDLGADEALSAVLLGKRPGRSRD